MKEEWKPILGYEGYYEVSNLGRVRSLDRVVHNSRYGDMIIKSRFLKFGYNKKGYLGVHLCKGGTNNTLRVNRLVAMAFLPNPENKREVNHKNGIKDDNRAREP